MNFDELADALKNGDITLADWEAQMRDFARAELTTAMILQRGGRDNVTPADWGFVGSQIKAQYKYLSGFTNDIKADPGKWLTGNKLNGRMALYNNIGYTALAEDERRDAKKSGGFTEERRVLDPSFKNCPGCLEQAALDWQPIGTLDPIGAEECQTHCKCTFEYR